MKFRLVEDVYTGDTVKFFTDGVKTIKLKPGDEIPDGFHLGRTFNVNTWNRGLTAQNDERVRKNTQLMRDTRIKNGSYNSWNKGLTKNTHPSLLTVSQKVSASRLGKSSWNKGIPASEEQKQKQSAVMKGRVPWNKGLTKETNASILAASNKLKGHQCFVTDWEAAKQKEYETKKRNHSFNSSKVEKDLISKLIDEYGEENVKHPYRDSRYPFNCDAYVVPLDLFIEVQGTVEHNGRPYDSSNQQDVEEADYIRRKAEQLGPDSRYWNIYKWWTEIDPRKLETLRKNNLNFKLIYPNNLIIDK